MTTIKRRKADYRWALDLAARLLRTHMLTEAPRLLANLRDGWGSGNPDNPCLLLAEALDRVFREDRQASTNASPPIGSPTPQPSPAVCIGCGCDDLHACVRESELDVQSRFLVLPAQVLDAAASMEPCHWLRLDRDAGLGVCSACPGSVERWDAGERDLDDLSLLKP